MNRTLSICTMIISWLFFPLAFAKADVIYEQPYLGHGHAYQPPTGGVAQLVANSEYVFVGVAETLQEGYSGRVRPTLIFKGRPPEVFPLLSWEPHTTGIGVGAIHLFFVRKEMTNLSVVKAMYIHSTRSETMRSYAALEGGREATLLVVKSLCGLPVSHGHLSSLLLKEASHENCQRRQTAALLACDLCTRDSLMALQRVIENEGDEFRWSAYTILLIDGENGVETLLKALTKTPRMSSLYESELFSLISHSKIAKAEALTAAFGEEYPQFRVSCAFALVEMIGTNAIPQIQKWKSSRDARKTKEKIWRDSSWAPQFITREELLGRAIEAALSTNNRPEVIRPKTGE